MAWRGVAWRGVARGVVVMATLATVAMPMALLSTLVVLTLHVVRNFLSITMPPLLHFAMFKVNAHHLPIITAVHEFEFMLFAGLAWLKPHAAQIQFARNLCPTTRRSCFIAGWNMVHEWAGLG